MLINESKITSACDNMFDYATTVNERGVVIKANTAAIRTLLDAIDADVDICTMEAGLAQAEVGKIRDEINNPTG